MVQKNGQSTLVILPIYNEENTLMKVITAIRRHYDGDLLAIDDGSTDNTPSILKKRLGITYVIRHKRNIGYGGALISGFSFAIKERYPYVLTIDADGDHDPSYIPAFFEEIKEFDIVSGTRYHLDSPIMTSILENPKRINDEIVEFINVKLGINITDAYCGFKAYRIEKLDKLHLDIKDYAFPLQVWVQAIMNGLRIKEVPVPLIFTIPRRDYDKILGSVDDTIEYHKRVILAEMEKPKMKNLGGT